MLGKSLRFLLMLSVTIATHPKAWSFDLRVESAKLESRVERLTRKARLYESEAQFHAQMKAGAEADLKQERALGAVTTWISSALIMAPVVLLGGAAVGLYFGTAVDMGITGTVATTGVALVGIGGTAAPTYWVVQQGQTNKINISTDDYHDRSQLVYFDPLEESVVQVSSALIEDRAEFDTKLTQELDRAERSWTVFNLKPIRYAAAIYARSNYMEQWCRAVATEMNIKRTQTQKLLLSLNNSTAGR